MKYVIGIDVGGSTTKIVGFVDGKIVSPFLVRANSPTASVYGAFGKFLSDNKLSLDDISKVVVTGVGSSQIHQNIYGIKTARIDEFIAIGRGGLFLSGLSNAVIVSMGTGTALVSANQNSVTHLGGSGVGGGTLLGLSNRMLNVRNFDDLVKTASGGNLGNIDLFIGDILDMEHSSLPKNMTASNFGKISDLAEKQDVALGIINLVFQTIGVISVFASRNAGTNKIVLTGNLTNVPQTGDIFTGLEALYDVSFIIPSDAEFATATGAAISYMDCEDNINAIG